MLSSLQAAKAKGKAKAKKEKETAKKEKAAPVKEPAKKKAKKEMPAKKEKPAAKKDDSAAKKKANAASKKVASWPLLQPLVGCSKPRSWSTNHWMTTGLEIGGMLMAQQTVLRGMLMSGTV